MSRDEPICCDLQNPLPVRGERGADLDAAGAPLPRCRRRVVRVVDLIDQRTHARRVLGRRVDRPVPQLRVAIAERLEGARGGRGVKVGAVVRVEGVERWWRSAGKQDPGKLVEAYESLRLGLFLRDSCRCPPLMLGELRKTRDAKLARLLSVCRHCYDESTASFAPFEYGWLTYDATRILDRKPNIQAASYDRMDFQRLRLHRCGFLHEWPQCYSNPHPVRRYWRMRCSWTGKRT